MAPTITVTYTCDKCGAELIGQPHKLPTNERGHVTDIRTPWADTERPSVLASHECKPS